MEIILVIIGSILGLSLMLICAIIELDYRKTLKHLDKETNNAL